MPRSAGEKMEETYQLWSRLPDKTDKHAVRQLSQQVGVPVKTIYDWIARYNWRGKWLLDVHAVAPQTLEEGLATLTQGWPLVTARLISIIANGKDQDAINASRVYAGLVGADKQQPLAPDKRRVRSLNPDAVDKVKSLSREELWEIARGQGAVNMDRSLAQRSSRNSPNWQES